MQTTIQFIRYMALATATIAVSACTKVVEREPVTHTSTTETTTVHEPVATRTTVRTPTTTETTTVRTPNATRTTETTETTTVRE